METSDSEFRQKNGADFSNGAPDEYSGEIIPTVGNNKKSERQLKIDVREMDAQLDKHLGRVCWIMQKDKPPKAKEDWEIDIKDLFVLGKIGQGTFGSVHRGIFQGQVVAVKFLDRVDELSKTSAEAAAIRATFRQEAAVWHSLQHPNITKFVGASMGSSGPEDSPSNMQTGPSNGVCVLAEYVVGGTLRSYLRKNRREKLPFDTVVRLALDLSRGLSYLHSQKVVHRDIKPENLLLDENGTLKIVDFGVARWEARNPKEMTGNMGTPGYMAPEVIDGNPYNRKADVYSFGICLWEMYCCKVPFGNMTFAQTCTAIVKWNMRPVIPRRCPSSVAKLMKICWDGSPEKRPEMEEVVRTLEGIDRGEGGKMPQLRDSPNLCGCFPLVKPSPALPSLE